MENNKKKGASLLQIGAVEEEKMRQYRWDWSGDGKTKTIRA